MKDLSQAREHLRKSSRIAILTGAGISAESGIPTFRGQGGLWKNYRAEDLATPEAYARNPLLVWEWYKMRFETVIKAQPNAAHYALAELAQTKNLTLVTQNVDGLHSRTLSQDGSKHNVLELHGNITKSRCERCGHSDDLQVNFEIPPHCSNCGTRARPNVVWFGELLPQHVFQQAVNAFATAEVAIIVGTSGVVEPAAGLARLAKEQGAYVIEINLQLTPLSLIADLTLQMSASEGLEQLLDNH